MLTMLEVATAVDKEGAGGHSLYRKMSIALNPFLLTLPPSRSVCKHRFPDIQCSCNDLRKAWTNDAVGAYIRRPTNAAAASPKATFTT